MGLFSLIAMNTDHRGVLCISIRNVPRLAGGRGDPAPLETLARKGETRAWRRQPHRVSVVTRDYSSVAVSRGARPLSASSKEAKASSLS